MTTLNKYLPSKFIHFFFLLLLLFLTSCNQVAKVETPKTRTISMKAGLVYKMGAQPVARTKFYLLKKDLKAIEEEKKEELGHPYYTRIGAESINRITGKQVSVGIDEDFIKDYIVARTTTDFEGNAKFENVPAGVYYVVGYAIPRNENDFLLWNIKVDTEKDKEAIFLDQNNATKEL
jgi:hypothetical protein